MSTIPPPLSPSRQSSTWSILRSLDTLSPPPSWSSLDKLDNLTACCQVGSIPVILHAGVGDLPNFLNGKCSEYDSSPVEPFNLAYKGVSDNTGAGSTESCIDIKSPKKGLAGPRTKPLEKTCPMKSLSRVPLLPQQPAATIVKSSSSPSIQELSSERPQLMVQKVSVHAAREYSPTFRFRSSGLQVASLDSCSHSPETGKASGSQRPSGHSRSDSTSTTNSSLSSHSNSPLITRNANRIPSENSGIPAMRFPLLPVSLSWLQSVSLEVMIDQEGFRMINPVFKLAGYSRPTTMKSDVLSLGVHLVSATADFMPLQRKSFAFHYSALDPPPVLRRLMVNGDGSRDYLSRQAFLILKANGPYTVRGTEPVVQPSRLFTAGEPPVLAWRFDYFVGDRRTEAGRIIPGEKTLTPLSFSCSPALLQSTQAKKIRVVQVVKKSIATKLTAMKMEPPMPPSPCPIRGATPLSNVVSEPVTGKYRRTQSNAQQNILTLTDCTHDSARLASYGTSGVFPPKSRVGESRAIVSTQVINSLFPVVVDE